MARKPTPMNRAQMRQCVQRWRPCETAQCLSLVKAACPGVFRASCHIRFSIHTGGGGHGRDFLLAIPLYFLREKKKNHIFKDRERKMSQERKRETFFFSIKSKAKTINIF